MKRNWISYCVIIVGIIIIIIEPILMRYQKFPVLSSYKQGKETVVIDPGHGGEDGGAFTKSGTLEKDINLSVSYKIRNLLEFFGVQTVMTREEDQSIHDAGETIRSRKVSDIKNRVKLVEDTKNPILLSIHLNYFPDPSCRGAQVFYSANNDLSKNLALTLQEKLKNGLADGNKRVAKKADSSIYILKKLNCPAVLTECGFLSNFEEEQKLISDEYQKSLAVCITAGYLEYKGQDVK